MRSTKPLVRGLRIFVFRCSISSMASKSALTESNRALARLSTVDPVTGLANRCAIDAYLSDQWARLERERLPVSLMLIDVDCFKSYNDHYGHRAGDRCLERVAGALRATLRQRDDLIARYGGEEFVIVLPATSEETAAEMAEHVRGRSSRPESRTISRASHASSPSASASPAAASTRSRTSRRCCIGPTPRSTPRRTGAETAS
nr:hypothetical protein [Gammaproteobacteria bacterium]